MDLESMKTKEFAGLLEKFMVQGNFVSRNTIPKNQIRESMTGKKKTSFSDALMFDEMFNRGRTYLKNRKTNPIFIGVKGKLLPDKKKIQAVYSINQTEIDYYDTIDYLQSIKTNLEKGIENCREIIREMKTQTTITQHR